MICGVGKLVAEGALLIAGLDGGEDTVAALVGLVLSSSNEATLSLLTTRALVRKCNFSMTVMLGHTAKSLPEVCSTLSTLNSAVIERQSPRSSIDSSESSFNDAAILQDDLDRQVDERSHDTRRNLNLAKIMN